MANVRLPPPDPFNFRSPDEWPKWKRRFEQYRSASGLASEDEPRQVSTLLYCLGEEADDVLTSTNITDESRKKYSEVMAKFDTFFNVRRNVIFERARFNRRNQGQNESAEQYITALYSLVETCEYGDLRDEMLRDRIVVGIRDTALSERLQLDSELTLEKAKKAVRQKEAVKAQHLQLRGEGTKKDPIVLDEVKGRTPPLKKRAARPFQKTGGSHQTATKPQCQRCGRDKHAPEKCPARNATCHKCNRKGHFSAQCFSKTAAASTNELSLDSAFLGTVSSEQEAVWTSTLLLGTKEIPFKLDTGAEVTAISEETYRMLGAKTLEKASKALYGPTCQSLKVLGQFTGLLKHQDHSSSQTIFVVRGLKTNLLGLPAITSLRLLQRINATHADEMDIRERFSKVFKGLGTLGEEYQIQLREGAKPYALYTPRNVPIPLRGKVQEELDRMESAGVISRVDQPTPWCAGMVTVPKKSGAVRICVDLKPLNESVLREVHPMPKVDETLAQLAGARVFSKLDANSGFWQIPLAEESRLLTTFVTPYGRYCFNKLPFGISSAPELFQKRMSKVLAGLEGVVCQVDDVLVFGKDKAEHDERLVAVLGRIEKAGITLNSEKCEFSKDRVKFLGHLIDSNGIQADPEKTTAILKIGQPSNITELRRFMGMANQLGKFSPHLAELSQPLRELLSTKRAWVWGPDQQHAFSEVKTELTRPTVLALYDPEAPTKVSADASSYGLGAVLLQRTNDAWRPVVYASRSLTETEKRYAQIEKEALAVTWACEKFANYILGCRVEIETDHKPLVPLLSTKHLDNLPPRVLRFRLRLARFDYSIQHVSGKLLHTADALSRAPITATEAQLCLSDEVETFIESVTANLPASTQRLEAYRKGQMDDANCQRVRVYCQEGWPKKCPTDPDIVPYWKARASLTLHNDLLLFNNRIVVPKTLQRETLEKIHEGHQGIQRCLMRVKSSVWWPGIANHITQRVQNCSTCAREASIRREPLMTTPLPDYPWQVLGSDLFQVKGDHYLLVVDYFSRYPEVVKLTSTTSAAVITALKAIFSRHGIPEVIRSDNGPQYASQEFLEFSNSYGFHLLTSSPRYPQSNGQAERTVQTVKQMLKKQLEERSGDPYMALLNYRATPLPWCNLSPTELLMGRRVRTLLPQTDEQLLPKWPYLHTFKQKNREFKERQKRDFDKRHRVQELPPLPEDTDVWVQSDGEPLQGRVVSMANAPRSYIVDVPSGLLHRNRQHLSAIPPSSPDGGVPSHKEPDPQPRRIMTRSQTGTPISPPERLA